MSPTEEFLSKENFVKGRKLITEAEIALKRAWLIILANNVLGYNDRHGAVEALQHSFELSLKALWLVVGLPYPPYHDPTGDFEKVKGRILEALPHLKEQPGLENWEKWVKANGKNSRKLHSTSIYGDEKGKMASELFTEEDVFNVWCGATMCYEMALLPIVLVGQELNLLSSEDKEYLEQRLRWVDKIKELGYNQIMDESVRNLFKT